VNIRLAVKVFSDSYKGWIELYLYVHGTLSVPVLITKEYRTYENRDENSRWRLKRDGHWWPYL